MIITFVTTHIRTLYNECELGECSLCYTDLLLRNRYSLTAQRGVETDLWVQGDPFLKVYYPNWKRIGKLF